MDIPLINAELYAVDYNVLLEWGGNLLSGLVIMTIGVVLSRRVSMTLRKYLGKVDPVDATWSR